MSQIDARIRQKRDTAANWTNNNPVLLNGELIVVETATGAIRLKVGDGVKTFNQLPFLDEAIYNSIDSKIATELADYATLEQAKVFLVTFSQDENGVYTADKSITDIKNAYDAGRMVLGLLGGEILPLCSAFGSVTFYTTDGKMLVGNASLEGETADTWETIYYRGVIIRRWFEYE